MNRLPLILLVLVGCSSTPQPARRAGSPECDEWQAKAADAKQAAHAAHQIAVKLLNGSVRWPRDAERDYHQHFRLGHDAQTAGREAWQTGLGLVQMGKHDLAEGKFRMAAEKLGDAKEHFHAAASAVGS